MTMDRSTTHPSEERLAAFAGADADQTSDRELAVHVAGCPRCLEIVTELVTLRAALAQLPDLAPPRPLRLLPPAVEPRPSLAERLAGIAHRTFAPLLAAGAGLVLVGAVGGVGSLGGLASAPAGATPAAGEGAALSEDATPTPGDIREGLFSTASPQDDRLAPAAPSASRDDDAAEERETRLSEPATPPWAALFTAGAVLIGVALTLRFVVAPRVG